jgi:hypothetical protein
MTQLDAPSEPVQAVAVGRHGADQLGPRFE